MSVSMVDGHIDPDKGRMTPQEAIQRIKQHNEIHSKKERFAIYITEALNMAVEALEKQMPKKVKMTNDLYPMAICPCCENEFIPHTGFEYCHYCGQAIDWSDRE